MNQIATSIRNQWRAANTMAAATPDHRNRFIDALRAVAILIVVYGHWLVAVVVVGDEGMTAGNLLDVEPWTQWLTWGFQVMPLFFIVGGYASAASWSAASDRGTSYREWLGDRLRRLFTPVVPLLVFWVVAANAGLAAGLDPAVLGLASMAALVPVWFLAVYLLMTMAAPFGYRLWTKHGYRVLAVLIVLAGLTDTAMRMIGTVSTGGIEIDLVNTIGWGNFLWVWGAMLVMGFAWHDRRLPHALLPAAIGLVSLLLLTEVASYSRSMVGVATEGLNNNTPPSTALIALGLLHFGIALGIEQRANLLLQRRRTWAAAIVMNSLIMTTYLWHLTVLVLVVGLATAFEGAGFTIDPGSVTFWATRPLLWLVLTIITIPLVLVLSRFERPKRVAAHPRVSQQMIGALCIFGGLATMARYGVITGTGFNWPAALLPLVGAGLIGLFHPSITDDAIDKNAAGLEKAA
ncbi:MAG: acyltransferase [Acidimicrobiia bacterium]|nr:acyltransferase [Acidimicrobiia bacterium]NNL27532.1 acyltransferase [Acidimicrobiia bacterium]